MAWSLRRRIRAGAPALLLLVAASPPGAERPSLPSFRTHDIATGLRGGYQVVVADLNEDSRPDVIAVATGMSELVWFENPTWERHVLVSGVAAPINASAADLDADGIPEIALASGFGTNPARSVGNLSLLTHGADPEQSWTVREIDRVPTAHRVRWYAPDGTDDELWLVDAPLAGATSQPPEYRGATPVHFRRPPEWKREALPELEEGVVHALEPVQWAGAGSSLLVAGFLGVTRYQWRGSGWQHEKLVTGSPAPWRDGGSSEASPGRLGAQRFLATIEPWHGNQVVVYRDSDQARRAVVDSTLADGHTLLVVDLDGDQRDEIVAGERGGSRSVRIYAAAADGSWTRTLLDEGQMGAAGCAASDLNADGLPDLVCIATSGGSLKWYENLGPR
jgi:hypothetical protein